MHLKVWARRGLHQFRLHHTKACLANLGDNSWSSHKSGWQVFVSDSPKWSFPAGGKPYVYLIGSILQQPHLLQSRTHTVQMLRIALHNPHLQFLTYSPGVCPLTHGCQGLAILWLSGMAICTDLRLISKLEDSILKLCNMCLLLYQRFVGPIPVLRVVVPQLTAPCIW